MKINFVYILQFLAKVMTIGGTDAKQELKWNDNPVISLSFYIYFV